MNTYATPKTTHLPYAGHLLLRFSLLGVALALSPQMLAQNDDAIQEIEEILVTASKRGATSQQETPLAISTVSGSQLDWRDSRNFTDFALLMPSVQFQDLGPGDKEYIIRGVNANGPAAVGAYFDEIVITANDSQDGGGKNADIYLADMERIEVLNGPQGTLYGANSMSGTVRFITNKPDPESFDAKASLDFGTTDGAANTNVEGMVNLPVSDVAALRFVAWSKNDGGWIDQPLFQGGPKEDINTIETTGSRILFRFAPENFRLDLMTLSQTVDVGGTSRYTPAGRPNFCGSLLLPGVQDALTKFDPAPTPPATNEPAAGPCNAFGAATTVAAGSGAAAFTPATDFQNTDLIITPWVDETEMTSVTLEFKVGSGSITATTGVYDRFIEYNFDSTWILAYFGLPTVAVTYQPQSRKITSSEVRYASDWDGKVQIVAGVYLHEEESRFNVRVTATDDVGNRGLYVGDPACGFYVETFGGTIDPAACPNGANFDIFGSIRNNDNSQQALFGEATITLSDKNQLIVGLRNFSADLTSFQGTPVPFGPPPGDRNLATDDSRTTAKITFHQDASETVNWYATYSQGFRVGGINNISQPFQAAVAAFYESDTLDNLEAGLKFTSAQRQWQGEIAAYFMQWKNIQVEPRDPESAAVPNIVNGGTAETLGLEASIRFAPSRQLSISFGGSFTDATLTTNQQLINYINDDNMPAVSLEHVNIGLSGNKVPNVPDVQLYAALDTHWVLNARPLRLGLEVAYRGEANSEFRTESAFNIPIPAYTLMNFRVAYQVAENWRVSGYINNLTDEKAVFDTIFNVQEAPGVVGARPQTIGVALDWRF